MTDSIQCLYGVSIWWMVVHLLIIYVTPQHGMQLMIWWNGSKKSFVHEYISHLMTGKLWPVIRPIASPWYYFCRIAGLQKWGFILMKIISNLSSWVGVARHCWEKSILSGSNAVTSQCYYYHQDDIKPKTMQISKMSSCVCYVTSKQLLNIIWILYFWHHTLQRRQYFYMIYSTRHPSGSQWLALTCSCHSGCQLPTRYLVECMM